MKIKQIKAREILDSLGIPTIETKTVLEDGSVGIASISSNIKPGKFGAEILRDGDKDRFDGLGVLKAVKNINEEIAPALQKKDASYQKIIDNLLLELDGTKDKSRLGGNSLFVVSQSVLEASANSYKMEIYQYLKEKYQLCKNNKMPTAIFSLIEDDLKTRNKLDFNEFQIIPYGFKKFSESLQCAQGIAQNLKKIIKFVPKLFTNMNALEILTEAVYESRWELGKNVFLGIDVKAENFYEKGNYKLKDKTKHFSSEDLFAFYQRLIDQYSIFSFEDPFIADDVQFWQTITERNNQQVLVAGGDFICADIDRMRTVIQQKAGNGIVLRPGQAGTITEAVQIMFEAEQSGWPVIISQPQASTSDDFPAHFAFGLGADYVEFGPPYGGERVVKYNKLLEIEKEEKK